MVPMRDRKVVEATHEPTTPGLSQEGNSASVPDIDSPPPEGLGVGSWPQLTSNFWRCSLSMNQLAHPFNPSNLEHRMAARILAHFGVRCSMLDVRCFPSAQGFQRPMRTLPVQGAGFPFQIIFPCAKSSPRWSSRYHPC